MAFDSLEFLAFLGVVLAVHSGPFPWRAKKLFLLVASYAFYAAWSPPFVLLLWGSTAVDWVAARGIAAAATPLRRRAWLALSLAANLGALGWFKYGGFLTENTAALWGALGLPHAAPDPWDVVLPAGISFYTFQTLSYTLDVWHGRERPWRSLTDFALFVTFFPQLVAGPIVRAAEFRPQLESERRATRPQLAWGLVLVAAGLFEKEVLADGLFGPVADRVYVPGSAPSPGEAWTGTVAFGCQILCDFAGYSTCAIGSALCLGFRLPDNFRRPYGALGFADFWHRWHVSLSTWLRDYVYVPMGGNRAGRARTYVHLMATMLLGGLWHGAAWTFVAWGGLHGLFLCAERWMRERGWFARPGAAGRAAGAVVTFALVTLAWTFFRARTFNDAARMAGAMLGSGAPRGGLVGGTDERAVWIVAAGVLAWNVAFRDADLETLAARAPRAVRIAVLGGLVAALVLFAGAERRAFLYFQF